MYTHTHTSIEQHQVPLPALPCSETMSYGWVGALPTPTPTHTKHTEGLKHNLLVYDPHVAHLVSPEKEKPIYYLLPCTYLMLTNPSIYNCCTGERSLQLLAT